MNCLFFFTMNPHLFIYFYFSWGSGGGGVGGAARQVVPGQPFQLLSF